MPPGKLPSDVGCIVMNVASAGFLGGYLKNGIPLTTKRVTLMVLQLQKLRTSEFRSVLRLKILLHSAADTKVHRPTDQWWSYDGTALMTDDFPVLKQNNAFLAFDEAEAKSLEPTACISCGRCVNACPMNLMPTSLRLLLSIRE